MTDSAPQHQSIVQLDARIDELEIRVAFLDELVERLNSIVAEQNQQLMDLHDQFKIVYRRVEQSLANEQGIEPFDVKHDIPPHY